MLKGLVKKQDHILRSSKSPQSTQSPKIFQHEIAVSSGVGTAMNGQLIFSSGGPTFIANPQNPNIALPNNMGHYSVVQLANLSSNVSTNFVHLANDAISLPNNYPTIFASAPPPLSPFNGPNGQVLLTAAPGSQANGIPRMAGPRTANSSIAADRPKSPKMGSISVKTAAALGLQNNVNSPPIMMTTTAPSLGTTQIAVDASAPSLYLDVKKYTPLVSLPFLYFYNRVES